MASYRIEWKNSAYKELAKLPRQMIPKIVEAVGNLKENPRPVGVKKLIGSEHSYRIRVGEYRVIYEIVEQILVIEIIRVRHRKDAYK